MLLVDLIRSRRARRRDGVAPREWNFIVAITFAVHRRSIKDLRRQLSKWSEVDINGRRYYYYLDFLLRHAIERVLETAPTRQNLESLANILWPEWSKLVSLSHETLFQTLLTVNGLAAPDDEVTDRRTSPAAATALGLLLENPVRDMLEMRRDLSKYLRETAASLEGSGILYP